MAWIDERVADGTQVVRESADFITHKNLQDQSFAKKFYETQPVKVSQNRQEEEEEEEEEGEEEEEEEEEEKEEEGEEEEEEGREDEEEKRKKTDKRA